MAGVTRITEGTANKYALLYENKLRFTRGSDGAETGQIDYDGVAKLTLNSAGGSSTGATRLDFQVNSGSKMVIDYADNQLRVLERENALEVSKVGRRKFYSLNSIIALIDKNKQKHVQKQMITKK